MNRLIRCVAPWLIALTIVSTVSPSVRAESRDDEQTLHDAGLAGDGPALLAFFHARARTDVDPDRLRVLLRQFAASSNRERSLATAEFLGLGSLAVPVLRRAVNDLNEPEVARRAAHCLRWLEGPPASTLPAAAARVLAEHKPEGGAEALLDYLPFADNAEVLRAVTAALAAVAAPNGKPEPSLLRGLNDPIAVRRAVAGVALCRANPPDQIPAVRHLLKDPAPGVRLRTALALAESHDAEAIPVLIELLADLPIEPRHRVEEFLTQLAGESAPAAHFQGEDEIARKIRRDAWAAWWRNTDGDALLAAIRKRTLTAEDRDKIRGLLAKLGSEDFASREAASKELFALGRRSLPQLREATTDKDAEVSRRAKHLIERIELEPSYHLPAAALRLLAVRKPAGSVEALLAYLPYAEDETFSAEARKSLLVLALREGKLDAALVRALSDTQAAIRSTAAEALAKGGGEAGRKAVRKLLTDAVPEVRLRVALALARVKERAAIPVMIDLLPVLPGEYVGQVEEALYQLAGDTAPQVALGTESADRRKCRDAWAAWWKVNAPLVDLGRLTESPLLGYTLICDADRVVEVDRQGKTRWSIGNLQFPTDAWVLPGNRVLITEWNACRVTERDRKGNVLWKKDGLPSNPVYAQRLPNGHTFIAVKTGLMLEVDRAGKEIYKIDKIPDVLYAYRSRRGNIVCLTQKGQCLTLDTTGNPLRNFAIQYPIVARGGLDLLSDGRILIASEQAGKVMEYDSQGKRLHEWDVPQATTATGLPNGHLLVSSQNVNRVVELDRAGKIVWEQTNVAAYRARRR